MNKYTPLPWQQNAIDKVNLSISNRILISAPTGAGKALFFMFLAEQHLIQNKRVLLLVDRVALVDQLSNTAKSCGLSHNILQADNRIDNNANFTIASIQTYFNIKHEFEPDIILIDEAHTLYNNLTNYLESFSGLVFGCTATPYSIGIGNIYYELINATTAHKLTKLGNLVPLKPLIMTKINMQGARTIRGEWAAKEVEERSAIILGDVVKVYLQHAHGKRSICFCATVEHCNEVASWFTANDIPVGVYTSKTSTKERKELLRKFDDSEILILISVNALAKGFDKHYIECILDLRPLRRSLAEYVQMIGRGIRANKSGGKTECLLLDFTGNWERFAVDYEQVYYKGVNSLDESERLQRIRKDEEIFTECCPVCDNLYFVMQCIRCGHKRIHKRIINQRVITYDYEDIEAIPYYSLEQHRTSGVQAKSIWQKIKNVIF